ncbi:MAG: LysM peptidoglycan-binding domain-containing protein [Chloroflexota bacterium]
MNQLIDTIRENLLTVIGVMFAALLTVVYLVLIAGNIAPLLQDRGNLNERLETAVSAQTQQEAVLELSNEEQDAQLEAAQARLDTATAVFLTEAQAATVLEAINQYAIATSVTLIEVEAQPLPQKAPNTFFDVRQFEIQAAGEVERLLQFLALMRETAVTTVSLTDVTLVEQNGRGTLSFQLTLYTSPFATGEALNNLPTTTVVDVADETIGGQPETGAPSPATQLSQQLDLPWAAENWPAVLTIIDQIIEVDPNFPEIREKQYSALVNFGYQLIESGNLDSARTQFETAVVINPLSGEAQAGLSQIEDLTTPTTGTTYTVQSGDTLFSIAQRFNTNVDAIRTANGIIGNNISVGQELIIPSN